MQAHVKRSDCGGVPHQSASDRSRHYPCLTLEVVVRPVPPANPAVGGAVQAHAIVN
jgi:hypothetical protein